MKKFGINRQWDKKDAIIPLLPPEVVEELKPLLRLTQDEADKFIYREVKKEILSLFGPRDEEAFQKAIALRLTGKPSALGKQLLHLICPGAKPFDSCHCAKIVFGFWHAQLTVPIKSSLAGQSFNKDTYHAMFKLADEVWVANGGTAAATPPVVAAVTATPPTTTTPPSDSSSAPQIAVAARGGRGNWRGYGRDRGDFRGGRGAPRGRGNSSSNYNQNNTNNQQNNNNQGQSQQNSGNASNNKPHQRGQKHSDLPRDASWACAQHWKKGCQAPYCSDPLVCQWVNVVAPRTA